ncbi:MAG: hypothetical protein FWF49_02535 [Oscillospiraceae bacterium]|nr:hypothetical protein [Oscillospiraceae bacterium]
MEPENVSGKHGIRKAIKITAIVLGAILVLALLARIVLISSVKIGARCIKYVDDYNQFYFYEKEITFNGIMESTPGYEIWFLPGQRDRSLNKIKEDVNAELTKMLSENSDILSHYTVSDNFRTVTIYYNKGAYDYTLSPASAQRLNALENELSQQTVALQLELYSELIYGWINSAWKYGEQEISFVEVS